MARSPTASAQRSAAGRKGGLAKSRNTSNRASGTRATGTKSAGTSRTGATKRSSRTKTTTPGQMPAHLIQDLMAWSLEEAARQQAQTTTGTSGST